MKEILRKAFRPIFLLISVIAVSFICMSVVYAEDITDTSGWTVVYPNNDQNDYLQDQQTGSGSVSQDIVGDATYPSTYMRFSADEMDVRIRLNNIDGVTPYQFKNFAFIGIDSDIDGGIDFFLGIYNPAGNNGRLGIYSADDSYTNDGPSSTGISGKPLMAFKPVDGTNYSIYQADSSFNSTTDYFVSFKFSLEDITEALDGTGITFTPSTPFRFMAGTAAQDNSFNQDLNGMGKDGWTSDDSWNTLGVFSDIVSADGTADYYTVTFDKNTGDTDANITVKAVEADSELGSLPTSNPTKRGMYFQEWNTMPDGSGTTATTDMIISADTILYAIWSDKPLSTVTFYPTDGSWDGSTTPIVVNTIDGIIDGNMPVPPTGSKNFVGWKTSADDFVNSTTIVKDMSTYDSINNNLDVYAVWANGINTAIFYDNYDGTGGDEVARIYSNGASPQFNGVAPSIMRTGYTFDGWYLNDPTCDPASTSIAASEPISSAGSYYAKWVAASYDVTFNENYGTTPAETTQPAVSGYVGTLPSDPIRDGYKFIEWNREPDGTGEPIYETTIISADTTLYAIWEPTYDVVFDAKGGAFPDLNTTWSTIAVDNQLELLPQPPSMDNYTFLGWSTTETGTTLVDLYNTDYTTVNYLYAVWTPNYRVTFNENYGATPATEEVLTAYGSVLYIPEDPNRTDYTFGTWNTEIDGSGTEFMIASDVSENMIVYAQWNSVPTAGDDAASTIMNTAVDIDVLGNDTDDDVGDTLSVISVTNGSNNATVIINPDGTVKYTPGSGFVGVDTFTYTISDGNGGEATASVTVYVGVNAPPTAEDDAYSVTENTTLTITAPGVMINDSDIDGTISAAILLNASNGTATVNLDGSFEYVPNTDYNGTDSFTYTITDNNGATATATVTITVNGADQTPTAADDSATTTQDVAIMVDYFSNDSNPDGGGSVSVDATSLKGGLIVDNGDGTFKYTPPAGYIGTDSFGYILIDGDGDSDSATVTITINSADQSPTAADDSAVTDKNTAVTIDYLSNDTNPDGGGSVSVDSISDQGGTIVDNGNGTFNYTPPNNFYGTDTFSYILTDGDGDSDSAVVTIKVRAIQVSPKTVTIEVGGTVDINETLLPSDASHDPVVWTSSKTSVATVDSNGNVTGIGVGRMIITATSGGVSDTCIVQVQSAEKVPADAHVIRVEGDIFYTDDEQPITDIEVSLYSNPLRGTSNNSGYFYLGYINEGSHTLTAESSPGNEVGRVAPVSFTRGPNESYVVNSNGSVNVTFTDATYSIYLRLEVPRSTGVLGVRDVDFKGQSVDNPQTGDNFKWWEDALKWFVNTFKNALCGMSAE